MSGECWKNPIWRGIPGFSSSPVLPPAFASGLADCSCAPSDRRAMSADRARILTLFEQHRARPGTPYDESHFLDFLLPDPQRKHAVHGSFRGLRRYNAFIDDVQLEFAICFSLKDRETDFSVDRFVARVE